MIWYRKGDSEVFADSRYRAGAILRGFCANLDLEMVYDLSNQESAIKCPVRSCAWTFLARQFGVDWI